MLTIIIPGAIDTDLGLPFQKHWFKISRFRKHYKYIFWEKSLSRLQPQVYLLNINKTRRVENKCWQI